MPNIEPGIRRKGNRLEAYVRINGELYSRTFPINTSLYTIREWRRTCPVARRWGGSTVTTETRLPDQFPTSPNGWCYLYVVRCEDQVKIGRAVNLQDRIRSLQQGCPSPLLLLAAAPAHANLEGLAHKRFHDTREDGEWFAITPEILGFAAHIREGLNPLTFFWPETNQANTTASDAEQSSVR